MAGGLGVSGPDGVSPRQRGRSDSRARSSGFKFYWPKIRIVISIAMLLLVVHRVKWASLIPQGRAAIKLLIFAAVIAFVGILLSVLRWQRVLSALGMKSRPLSLVRMYFASLFVSNFLPSTIGGDIARASWLSRLVPGSDDAVASVVLERFSGWFVLPVITITGLLLNPQLLRLGPASRLAVAVCVVTLIALVGAVFLAFRSAPSNSNSERAVRRYIESIRSGLFGIVASPRLLVEVLAVSFAYQLVVVASAVEISHALSLSLSWTVLLAFVPAVAILQVVPVTFGGLGIREGAFILFLRPLGVSTSQAIALGLLVYGINLALSLFGAFALAVGHKRDFAKPSVPV